MCAFPYDPILKGKTYHHVSTKKREIIKKKKENVPFTINEKQFS